MQQKMLSKSHKLGLIFRGAALGVSLLSLAVSGQANDITSPRDGASSGAASRPAPAKASPGASQVEPTAVTETIVDIDKWSQRARLRATERWTHISLGRYGATYEYLTPTGRATVSKEEYVKQVSGPGYRNGQIDSVSCTEALCTVNARAEIMIQIPRIPSRSVPVFLEEHWVLINGEMWLLRK